MHYLLYSLLLALLIAITIPFWLWKYFTTAKYRGTLQQRLGFKLPIALSDHAKPRIWVHAVSVGETLAAKGLVEKLAERFTGHEIVLSTVTKTGQQVAVQKLSGVAATFYLPLDFTWIVQRVIDQVQPRFFVVMETELWPNLFFALHKRQIPIFTVNGRLSPGSFKNYRRMRYFMQRFLQPVTLFAMQSSMDAERMAQIGGSNEIIRNTGNIKYDQAIKTPTKAEMEQLFKKLPPPTAPVWIAASTHPGEEEQVLTVFKRLREQHNSLRLILVPRHPERAGKIADMIKQHGWDHVAISTIEDAFSKQQIGNGWQETILLVDQVGWLTRIYGYAQVAYVGGSLVPHGGQNMLEPAAWSIPPVFGPYTHNFKDASQQIIDGGGGVRVRDAEELYAAIFSLLNSPQKCRDMGVNAHKVVAANTGALQRTVDAIATTIAGQPLP